MSELPAGRELDALVAEKVMGWHRTSDSLGNERWADANGRQHRYVNRVEHGGEPAMFWCPSLSIAAAWEVVEKLWRNGSTIVEALDGDLGGRGFWVSFDGTVGKSAFAISAPLAICRAALKAVA